MRNAAGLTWRERRQMRREGLRDVERIVTPAHAPGPLVRRLRARLALRNYIIRAVKDPVAAVVVGAVVGVVLVAFAVGVIIGAGASLFADPETGHDDG